MRKVRIDMNQRGPTAWGDVDDDSTFLPSVHHNAFWGNQSYGSINGKRKYRKRTWEEVRDEQAAKKWSLMKKIALVTIALVALLSVFSIIREKKPIEVQDNLATASDKAENEAEAKPDAKPEAKPEGKPVTTSSQTEPKKAEGDQSKTESEKPSSTTEPVKEKGNTASAQSKAEPENPTAEPEKTSTLQIPSEPVKLPTVEAKPETAPNTQNQPPPPAPTPDWFKYVLYGPSGVPPAPVNGVPPAPVPTPSWFKYLMAPAPPPANTAMYTGGAPSATQTGAEPPSASQTGASPQAGSFDYSQYLSQPGGAPGGQPGGAPAGGAPGGAAGGAGGFDWKSMVKQYSSTGGKGLDLHKACDSGPADSKVQCCQQVLCGAQLSQGMSAGMGGNSTMAFIDAVNCMGDKKTRVEQHACVQPQDTHAQALYECLRCNGCLANSTLPGTEAPCPQDTGVDLTGYGR